MTLDSHIEAALKPVIYADIFDYPLTLDEIYYFLERKAGKNDLQRWLAQAVAAGRLAETDGFYTLTDRTQLVTVRQQRRQTAGRLWPTALTYGHRLGCLPFVRMVAVTGSLAVDNPRSRLDDIDYLIVTQPRRLWLCRAMIILLVRWGHQSGVHLCPNYLITENALEFEQNLFSAREILQMKPVYGRRAYLQLRQRNRWTIHYFPQSEVNHHPTAGLPTELPRPHRWAKRLGERLLSGPLGAWLENRLQHFQINRHTRQARQRGSADTLIFSADVCKGHYEGHGQRTLAQFQARLHAAHYPPNPHPSSTSGQHSGPLL